MKIREFFGLRDKEIDRVALYSVFPWSAIVVVMSVELEDRWPLIIEGPDFQLDFLEPLVSKMVKSSPKADEFGSWVGLYRKNQSQLRLFYRHGWRIQDHIELLEHKFRRDIISYSNVRLSYSSLLEVVCGREAILQAKVGLPADLKNGEIEIPSVIWKQ